MKSKFLITIIISMVSLSCLAQGKQKIIAFTPIIRQETQVNGLAIGGGHAWDRDNKVDINGLNIEINPLTPLILLFQDPSRVPNDAVTITLNGLHLSTGGFSGQVVHNGVAVSVYNITMASNGVSITGLYNVSKTLKGVHIAGLANSSDNGIGLLIAPFNHADQFNGFQLGLSNKSETCSGIQIGLLNRTKAMKGLQVGLWNINEKRSMPFINW